MSTRTRKSVLFVSGLGIVAVMIGAFAWTAHGQYGYSKYTSPPAKVEATIAGKKITIDYYSAFDARVKKVMGASRSVRRSVVHGRELGDENYDRGGPADGQPEIARRVVIAVSGRCPTPMSGC